MITNSIFSTDVLLHMIYKHRLPTVKGGGINIPIICPAFLRSELGIFGNPGARLKLIVKEQNFPFHIVHQSGVTKKQMTFPPHLDWAGFVGADYTPNNVGCYAFLPQAFQIPNELNMIQHNLGWWPGDILLPYAHFYEEQVITPIIEERKDHE